LTTAINPEQHDTLCDDGIAAAPCVRLGDRLRRRPQERAADVDLTDGGNG